jgi:hypothetical protein
VTNGNHHHGDSDSSGDTNGATRMSLPLQSMANLKITPEIERRLIEQSRSATKRARPSIWAATHDGAPDSYVGGPNAEVSYDGPRQVVREQSHATIVADDGTVSFVVKAGDMEQSRVAVDGHADPVLPNGVRLAYHEEHRNGFQRGRLRVYGGNLVLMPSQSTTQRTATRATTQEERATARLLRDPAKELARMERELAAAMAALESMLAKK